MDKNEIMLIQTNSSTGDFSDILKSCQHKQKHHCNPFCSIYSTPHPPPCYGSFCSVLSYFAICKNVWIIWQSHIGM